MAATKTTKRKATAPPLRLEWIEAGSLAENPHNWRRHPEHQMGALRDVLGDPEIGWAGACLYNERTQRLVDGHARRKAVSPETPVPVLVGSWSEAAEKKILLTLDPLAGLAEADPDQLRALAADVTFDSPALKDLCDGLLAKLEEGEADLRGKDDTLEEDVPPEPPEKPESLPGDMWLLGRHRLLCGDATSAADVQRLMGGRRASLVFTDPPYNVNYEGKTADALKIQNDKMDATAFRRFLRDAYSQMYAASADGAAIYVCHADSEGENFRAALRESGYLLKQTLVWVKNVLVLGRQDYHWRHEPILYGWKPGSHRFYGGRKQTTVIDNAAGVSEQQGPAGVTLTFQSGLQTLVIRVPSYEVVHSGADGLETVWRFDKPVRNGDHPTMKPVNLPGRAIRNSTLRGEVVLDSFLGSGSTLVAAEQTDRACFGLELDPRYADVIVRRWEELTGKKADRVSAG